MVSSVTTVSVVTSSDDESLPHEASANMEMAPSASRAFLFIVVPFVVWWWLRIEY